MRTIYTPKTTWIQDAGEYAPGSNDQINVLADLQPGKADIMFDVGLRSGPHTGHSPAPR